MSMTKFPYECIVKETGKKFIPTRIDYDNQQVWWQKSQASDSGEWLDFDEVTFIKNSNFVDLDEPKQETVQQKKHMTNVAIVRSFNKLITNNQRTPVMDMFEKVMTKYIKKANAGVIKHGNDNDTSYNYGVADGINHCFKMIQGLDDDYLDGVE